MTVGLTGNGLGGWPLLSVAVALGNEAGVAVVVSVGGMVTATGTPVKATPSAPTTNRDDTQTGRPFANLTKYHKPPGSRAISGAI